MILLLWITWMVNHLDQVVGPDGNYNFGCYTSSKISSYTIKVNQGLCEEPCIHPTQNDLQTYLAEVIHPMQVNIQFNILAWWKLNEAKYPIVAKMAHDIPVVSITTIAFEVAFRTIGSVLIIIEVQ